MDVHLYTPNDYVGGLMDLCQNKRGTLIDMKYLDDVRVDLHYAMPLGEIVYDFFDAIKSRSRGYASYDYEFKEYRESDLVKLDFLLNGDPVDALSMIVFRDNAYAKGRRICEKLRDNIPATCSEIRCRPPSAAGSSPARRSRPCARTCWPSATAAISPARRSCWKSRRKAKEDAPAGQRFPAQRGFYCCAQAGQRRRLNPRFSLIKYSAPVHGTHPVHRGALLFWFFSGGCSSWKERSLPRTAAPSARPV